MFLQQPGGGINFSSVQLATGSTPTLPQATSITMQGQVVPASPVQGGVSSGHINTHVIQQQSLLRDQTTTLTQSQQQSLRTTHNQQTSLTSQTQNTLPPSLYNTMMISQPGSANVVQIASSLAQNTNPGGAVATFTQDRQIRFPQGQQLVTKLVTAPMACGAVMVPTTMFMGQVVTAYPTFAAQQQQQQTISITQQQQNQQEQQQNAVQQPTQAQAQLSHQPQQFMPASRLLHGSQSTQLILSAAFPIQQQGTFTQAHHQQQQSQPQTQNLSRRRTDSMSDPSSVQLQ
ncbi:CLOCK protein, partial [Polypterus senegalus]